MRILQTLSTPYIGLSKPAMEDILAAVGIAQLKKLNWLIDGKRERADQLTERLQGIEGLRLPVEPDDCRHSYQSYVTVLDEGVDRDAVIGQLRERGVETTLGTYAMHAQPAFRNRYSYQAGDLPTSWHLFKQTLTLPLYPQMTSSDLDFVAEAVQATIN